MTSNKKLYVQPKLTVYGEVETLTQGLGDGNTLDKAFPAKTPKKDLTFS
ncbi:lasso RiPP family leader peptide-containing protein [Nostoc sp. UHCC 0302]